MKDGSFLIMIIDLTAIMLNHLNIVASVPLVCTGMEKSGIFITFKSSPNFAPLLPEKELSLSHST
jgi:hypothetical protein